MRRNWVPPFVLVAALVGVGGAFAYYEHAQQPRYTAARAIVDERSRIQLDLAIDYRSGSVARESYRMIDDEGASSLRYQVLGRGGLQITILQPAEITLAPDRDVAFLFDRVVADGIWKLRSKPPRGDTNAAYAISIAQLAGTQHGSYRFVFTDPHYWATTGGHQFTLHLHKGAPLPDLLQMSSTTLVEPRYASLVADFESFGPAAFLAKSAAARARIARGAKA